MDFRGKRIFFNIIGAILAFLLVVFSFFALVNVAFNLCYIKTDIYDISMYPTLNATVLNKDEQGDRVYINKFAGVSNGDIVVARVAWNAKPIIKRLVASPFDTFYIKQNGDFFNLYVNEKLFYSVPEFITYPSNNTMITESSVEHYNAFLNLIKNYSNSAPDRIVESASGEQMIKLYANEYLLVGDNWAGSDDVLTALSAGNTSKFVTRAEIVGKADIVIYKGQNVYANLLKQMMKMIFSF